MTPLDISKPAPKYPPHIPVAAIQARTVNAIDRSTQYYHAGTELNQAWAKIRLQERRLDAYKLKLWVYGIIIGGQCAILGWVFTELLR